MFKNSLRARLLVPVLALVLTVVIVATVVLAFMEADKVRSDATTSIERQSKALQSLFAVTRSIMLERVQNSMRLLRQQGEAQGLASAGPVISVGDRQANDIIFGKLRQGNRFELVDGVTEIMDGTATLFSKTGDDFVRVSTNVKKADGSRAVGTQLDPNGPVIGEIRKNRKFAGVVDILGNPYVTEYDPIPDATRQDVIGIWYVGYKTDLQPLDAVISDSRVLDSGFVALFDSKGKLRFHSKSGATTDTDLVEKISKEPPAGWTVVREDVPGWDFSLVSAYPKSDVNNVIFRQSLWIAAVGVALCLLLLGLQSSLILNRVLRPIQRLTTVADDLSLGKPTHSIPETKLNDEIGTLARAIARLSNSVRVAMERLQKRG